jgi:hypothetical protein
LQTCPAATSDRVVGEIRRQFIKIIASKGDMVLIVFRNVPFAELITFDLRLSCSKGTVELLELGAKSQFAIAGGKG